MPRRHVRLFELPEFSDYRKPRFERYFGACALVIVTAVAVLLLTKMCGATIFRSGGDDCAVCDAASARRSTTAAAHAAGGTVEEITSKEHLEEVLHSEEGVVVKFMAPWCGHCQELKPVFHAAAKEDRETRYAMCDCEAAVGHDTLEKHKIEAFPTVRYYRRGEMVDEYRGARTKEDLVSWARTMKG